jgi:DNA (cytosine-5)-methyltransferase 1
MERFGFATSARFEMSLILSLFPGADLLGRGFEFEGFCVVRGPDILWGQDVRDFHPAQKAFEGIIGGSPCQDFSKARRTAPTGEGLELLGEFARVVTAAEPEWFLLENVPAVPSIAIDGYKVQRLNLNARECGLKQNRLRCFQFGSRDGAPLVIRRRDTYRGESQEPCCLATEGKSKHRRDFADFCELQGLPRNFDMPGLSRAAKYKAVGNGVPVQMARVIAGAIKVRNVTRWTRLCICECGQPVRAGQTMATAACRKRMQRKRESTIVTGPGIVTPAESLLF